MQLRPSVTRTLIGFAVGGLILGLTACGGQSLSATDANTDGANSSAKMMPIPDEEEAKGVLEGITVDEELAALVPDAVRESGLRATTSVGYPPMEEWSTDGSDVIGVDPALAHAIARTLGLELTIQDQEFNAMIPGLLSGRYDILLSSMTDNEERRETTSFVDYVQVGNAFLVAKGNPDKVSEPLALCGKTVAVVESGSSAVLAEEFSAECVDAGQAAYDILKLAGDSEANLSVQSGRATATITDYPVAVERTSDPEMEMEAVRIEGDESIWGIGIDKADEELVNSVQQALQSLMDDGTYEEILEAWGLQEMAIPEATVNGGK